MSKALLLGLSLLVSACNAQQSPPKTPLAVAVQTVVMIESAAEAIGPQSARYTAVLTPRELINLAFKVPGYVDAIDPKAMDKGSRVSKGQVLAALRNNDYKSKLAQARFALDEAKSSLVLATQEQQRNARLIEQQVISRSELDRTAERQGVATARVAQAAAALEQADINLHDATLVSPMNGYLVRREVERGTLVNQGSVAFVLADLSSVKAVFGLPDHELTSIKLGDHLRVSTQALPGREFQGVVTAISPTADPKSRAFDVELSIPNPEYLLRDGLIVSVGLNTVKNSTPLAAIPVGALAKPLGGNEFAVHVVSDKQGKNIVEQRVVNLVGVSGDMATFASGLAPGELVITRGTSLAAHGQEVRIIR